MHQIDRRVGLQQIAPDALARMRFAGNQQHPQPFADTVDLHHGAVVGQRQFARRGFDLDLDDIGAGMFDLKGNRVRRADRRHDGGTGFAVEVQLDAGDTAAAPSCRVIDDPDLDIAALADQREARRMFDGQLAVPFAARAGQHDMDRSAEDRRRAVGRRVVDLPVGNQDGARHALFRDIGQRPAEAIEDAGAVDRRPRAFGRRAGADHAHVQVLHGRQPGPDMGQRGLGLGRALRDLLAGRRIDDHGGDIVNRRAFFLDQHRVRQREP